MSAGFPIDASETSTPHFAAYACRSFHHHLQGRFVKNPRPFDFKNTPDEVFREFRVLVNAASRQI
jgi:hypothetical protein